MVRCQDGSLYTGWTNKLEERIRSHNSGKGAKYTRARGPVELVYTKQFESKSQAMSHEYFLKRLKKEEKESLVKEFQSHKLYQVQGG